MVTNPSNMVETNRTELAGKILRYAGRTWVLTGEVDVRKEGTMLAVDATQEDDVRHRSATLHFDLRTPPDALNPGGLGDHFDRLEWEGGKQYLVVKKDRRTYRYELKLLTLD